MRNNEFRKGRSLLTGDLRTKVRYLVSGGVNTALTYGIYLALLPVLPYHLSFTIAYGAGILLAYVLFRSYVFRSKGRSFGLLLVAGIYVLQYLLGLGIVHLWVEYLSGPAAVGPLVAVAFTLPVSFVLSRSVFRNSPQASDISPARP